MSVQLTKGAIMDTYRNKTDGTPYVQIIDIKELPASQNNKRFRLVISDGVHYQQAMLTTQLNHLVENNQITQFCIVQLKEYLCNVVSGRRIVIVLNVDVIDAGSAVGSTIGNPTVIKDVDVKDEAASNAPPAQNGGGGFGATPNSNVPSYMNRNSAPPARAAQNTHPISSLNPYNNRWTIKARVTSKSDVRTWSNARGDGKLFSVDLLDSHGGQIRCTMFNDAVDKFYDVFQQNSIYTVSKGNLKIANKRFSTVPNEYEITLNADAEVGLCDDDGAIETQKFDFVTIDMLSQIPKDDNVDVIGIVKSVSNLVEITSQRTMKELKKRTVQLMDASLTQVDITLWGEQAQKYDEQMLDGHPVLAIKSMRVSDFGGRSLNSTFSSQLFIDIDIDAAHKLRAWWDSQGSTAKAESISQQRGPGMVDVSKTFSEVTSEGLGTKEKPDYFNTKCTITFFKFEFNKPPWYLACPSENCNKKVTLDESTGQYTCEKCNQSYDSCEPRYILSLMCCDHSGSHWMTAFNESAEKLLGGVTAKELNAFKEMGDETSFSRAFREHNFKTYNMKIRAKADFNQDEQRVRLHALQATPLDFRKESLTLLEQIEKYD